MPDQEANQEVRRAWWSQHSNPKPVHSITLWSIGASPWVSDACRGVPGIGRWISSGPGGEGDPSTGHAAYGAKGADVERKEGLALLTNKNESSPTKKKLNMDRRTGR